VLSADEATKHHGGNELGRTLQGTTASTNVETACETGLVLDVPDALVLVTSDVEAGCAPLHFRATLSSP
jgi:hypothetical protein